MLLWQASAHAHPVVQVRGAAQLDADVVASADGSYLTVRGRLEDELGEAIARVPLRLEKGQRQGSTTPWANPLRCPEQSARVAVQDSGIETDDAGRFCVQVPSNQLPMDMPLHVTFDGNAAYGKATVALMLEDRRSGLLANFGPLSRVIDLDTNQLAFVIELRPISPSEPRNSPTLTLELSIRSTDSGKSEDRRLERMQANVGVPTRIEIPTARLGRPGPADLVLAFDGNQEYKPLRSLYRIERTTSVGLSVSGWPQSIIAGDRFTVRVNTTSAIRWPAPGFLELVDFDGNPTAFALRPDGSAEIVLQTPPHPRGNSVAIRYRSSAPGWRAQEPLRLVLEILPPSRWNLVGWIAAALLVIGWFAWSRRRAEPGAAAVATVTPPRPYAHLEIIESASDPNAGWSAVVVDAHEGTEIPRATVELTRPGFDRVELLFATTSNDAGQFQIPPQSVDGASACRLEVTAEGYARFGLLLPSPGRIKVHLVSARRAILDRLVSWAKRRGQPFDSKTEPTPDWIAGVARAKAHPEIETWAKAVSIAAFGVQSPSSPESQELLPPLSGLGSLAEAKRNDK